MLECATQTTVVSNFGAVLSGLVYAMEPAGLFEHPWRCLVDNGAVIELSCC
jgi:hypothetical protein